MAWYAASVAASRAPLYDNGGTCSTAGLFRSFNRRTGFCCQSNAGLARNDFATLFRRWCAVLRLCHVVILAAAIRWGFGFHDILALKHIDSMALVILASSLIMTLSYATECFTGWYRGKQAERDVISFAFTGSYAPLFWSQLLCNCLMPQFLWLPAMRRCMPVLIVVSTGILIGMWLERILIIWNTLSRGYMPSMYRLFSPTVVDWLLLFAPLGLFALLSLIFLKVSGRAFAVQRFRGGRIFSKEFRKDPFCHGNCRIRHRIVRLFAAILYRCRCLSNATREGVFHLLCTQLCGTEHARIVGDCHVAFRFCALARNSAASRRHGKRGQSAF
jgi:hypothetical protein